MTRRELLDEENEATPQNGGFDMKLFTELYVELDQTNKTNEKVEAMRFYFEHAEPHDAAWALYFLSGRKPRQIVPSKLLAAMGSRIGRHSRMAF